MDNHAFKQESALGAENENKLREFVEKNNGWSIDGKYRNSTMGKKYTANFSDLKDSLLSKLDKSVHLDFVFEKEEDNKVIPVFIDSKSTGCSHKDATDIAIKAQCFKNKFPDCEIHLIYHGLQSKYWSVLDKLVDSGLITGYSNDGLCNELLEHIIGISKVVEPKINKFF